MRRALLLFILLLTTQPVLAQQIIPPGGGSGSGGASVAMSNPTSLSVVLGASTGSLADGTYKVTVTCLDLGGNESYYPPADSATTASPNSRIQVTFAKPTGATTCRIWTSAAGGATPDRYFTTTSASYNLDTLTGATLATLPISSFAYLSWLGSSATWFGSATFQFPASGYINWGSPAGSSGYGVRDNGGNLEFKNSGGSWNQFMFLIAPRTTSITSSATPTPDASTTDLYILTALAASATFGAPTGSPADGQMLSIRIKDNGSSQTLGWNAAYRAGSDLALPTATVAGKVLYLSFSYNTADAKWDFVAQIGGF